MCRKLLVNPLIEDYEIVSIDGAPAGSAAGAAG